MRQRAKVDTNQPDLVKLWRDLHLSVHHTHQLGGGFVDTVLGCPGLTIVSRQLDPAIVDFILKKMGLTQYRIYAGCNLLVEVKDGSKPPSAQRLTPDEERFHQNWLGQVSIVNSIEEARKLVGLE